MRLGTLSLLAGIDLLTGEAVPLVSESHKSSDFIAFLEILNAKYPEEDTIRLILDNHSAHKSKETRKYLTTLPEDRFVFVFTPTHASWLNIIESFFSKMTMQMLKGIRVSSEDELLERIGIVPFYLFHALKYFSQCHFDMRKCSQAYLLLRIIIRIFLVALQHVVLFQNIFPVFQIIYLNRTLW